MSHFYIGSSDYTNGGNRQKYSVMAYGTSAAICASFHWNWHHGSWWSVVTAKNTARAVQREREEEGWGMGRGVSLPQTSALMSFCISHSTIKRELASVGGDKIWARGETGAGESSFTHPPFPCTYSVFRPFSLCVHSTLLWSGGEFEGETLLWHAEHDICYSM